MSPQPTAPEHQPLDPTPLYKPADIADVATRHGLTAVDQSGREFAGTTPDGRTVLVTTSPLWSRGAARLAVGATDDLDDWDLNLGYACPVWALDTLLAGLMGATAPREDECSGCEGWAEVDERNLCAGCAHQIDHDPWHVLAGIDAEVAEPGPYTQEQAELAARVHNDSLRFADRGVLWRAARIARTAVSA